MHKLRGGSRDASSLIQTNGLWNVRAVHDDVDPPDGLTELPIRESAPANVGALLWWLHSTSSPKSLSS